MNFDPDARPTVFHASFVENHRGLLGTDIPKLEIHNRLFQYLAEEISHSCIETEVGKYSTEHRLRVYVLTVDQLERLVQKRAERLYPSIPSIYETGPKP